MIFFNNKDKAKREYQNILQRRDKDYDDSGVAKFTQDEFGQWFSSWEGDITPIKEEYEWLRSAYWTKRAAKCLVELPDRDPKLGNWKQQEWRGQWTMTDKGVAQVRKGVRKENLANTEMWFRVGIIVVGVCSVLLSFFQIVF